MTDAGGILAAFVFVLTLMFVPRVCRPGWYVEGVRPTGASQCRPVPPRNCGEPVPPFNLPCPKDPRVEPIGIYCTGGSHPIVVNAQTIGCQR